MMDLENVAAFKKKYLTSRGNRYLMKIAISTRFVFWITVLCLCLESQIGLTADAGKNGRLRIIYGTGLSGYWEHCGCHSKQAGGLSRQKTVADMLKEEVGGTNSLFINCGDNIGRLTDGRELEERKASLIYKLTGQIGVDVLAPGASDFQFGVDFLKDTALLTTYPFVCANLVDKATGKNVFEPYVVLKRGGIRTLVTGVINESFNLGDDNVRVTLPDDALREIIESVSHDYAVVVFHTTQETAQRVAASVGGVDQILLGEKNAVGYLPVETGSGFMAYANDNGRNIGYFDILRDENGKLSTMLPEHVFASFTEIEGDREIQRKINRFKFRDLEARYPNKQKIQDSYMGVEWCIRCHKEQYEAWLKTGHASALDTLSEKGEAENETCLKCHETKRDLNGAESADNSFFEMFNLPGVQCEACHGPGGRHTNDPKENLMMEADAQTCIACHNKKMDPDFNFATDRLKGTH